MAVITPQALARVSQFAQEDRGWVNLLADGFLGDPIAGIAAFQTTKNDASKKQPSANGVSEVKRLFVFFTLAAV